jgi:hypothetical protein
LEASGAIKGVVSDLAGWDGTSAEEGDSFARESSIGRTPMTLEEALSTPVVPMFDIASLAMLNHSKESINSLKQSSIVDFDSKRRQQNTGGISAEKRTGYVHSPVIILFVAHFEPQLVLEAGGSGRWQGKAA